MLIDAEDSGTWIVLALRRSALQEVLEPALDGGTSDAFPLSQTTAADPVPVPEVDALTKGLGGSPARQDAGESLPEAAAAFLAAELSALQFQDGVAQAPTLVPHLSKPAVSD